MSGCGIKMYMQCIHTKTEQCVKSKDSIYNMQLHEIFTYSRLTEIYKTKTTISAENSLKIWVGCCVSRNTAVIELICEYHKFNFSESYGTEMMKVAPR